MPVEIVEVLRRSDQGMTKPFICRGNDDEIYFVKGTGAGRRSQICEWIAGNLGLAMNLPLAPFEIVYVPEELIDLDVELELNDLGAGAAFASRERRVAEVTCSVLGDIPKDLQQDVLIFDWWTLNGDRCLSEKGGNPNLFWQPEKKELVVIDHNQAFDLTVNKRFLMEGHIFREQMKGFSADDFFRRNDYNSIMSAALEAWEDIVTKIPESWYYADNEMTVPVDFDLDATHQLLKRYLDDGFWDWT